MTLSNFVFGFFKLYVTLKYSHENTCTSKKTCSNKQIMYNGNDGSRARRYDWITRENAWESARVYLI